MSGSLPPSPVQTFMTHLMTDEAVQVLSTGREKQTQQVKEAVLRSLDAAPGALQHVVIYGPRGFGKSFMARLVQIETARLATQDAPIPFVLLPEEQHNLTRNPHALLAYIAHRIADLRTGEDRSWTGAMFQWPDPDREAPQWDDNAARLEAELDLSLPAGRGMAIVVIENFDFLLANVFKDEVAEQRLRKWLDRRDNRIMLVATATGSVDMEYERPLFQAFQSIRLEPWSQDSCIAYFNRRRELEGKQPLDAKMEAKARAVADFIGGNPRLAQLLGEVLETEDALSVAGTMNALADKLSDYYRRRIDDLPPLAQGLLDALIRGGEPASRIELAKRVGAGGHSTITRTIQDMERADIIVGLSATDGDIFYRVTDRVFVHFYRLRQGNQVAALTPLATILDFLRSFYSREEQKAQAVQHLGAGRPAEARLFAELAREGGAAGSASNVYFRNFGSRLKRIAASYPDVMPMPFAEILREIEERPEGIASSAELWQARTAFGEAVNVIIASQALARMGLVEQADIQLKKEVSANTAVSARVLLHVEWSLLARMCSHRKTVIQHSAIAGEILPGELPGTLRSWVLRCRSWLLAKSGLHDAALAAAREALTFATNARDTAGRAAALRRMAWSLGELGRHEEALVAAREAVTLATAAADIVERTGALRSAAWSLGKMGRHEEALGAAREAVTLATAAAEIAERISALRSAAWLLGELGRHEEALVTARDAAAVAATAGDIGEQAIALRDIAWLLGELGRHEEALTTAREGAALAATTGNVGAQAVALRNIAWWLGELGRHEEAIANLGDAADLAIAAGDIYEQSAALRSIAWSLGQLGRHEKALATAREANTLAVATGDIRGQAVALRLAAWSLNQTARHEEALSAALESFELADSTSEGFEVQNAAIAAIQAAAYVPSDKAVRNTGRWIELNALARDDEDRHDWWLWFDDLLAAATRARAWDSLDKLLDDHLGQLTDKTSINYDAIGSAVGSAIARTASAEGRVAGFAAAQGIVPRIDRVHAVLGTSDRFVHRVFSSAVSAFATNCQDPDLIRDIAGLLISRSSVETTRQASLLFALAEITEAPNSEAVLARMDPDVALWLRRIRHLPEPSEKPRRRKTRKG